MYPASASAASASSTRQDEEHPAAWASPSSCGRCPCRWVRHWQSAPGAKALARAPLSSGPLLLPPCTCRESPCRKHQGERGVRPHWVTYGCAWHQGSIGYALSDLPGRCNTAIHGDLQLLPGRNQPLITLGFALHPFHLHPQSVLLGRVPEALHTSRASTWMSGAKTAPPGGSHSRTVSTSARTSRDRAPSAARPWPVSLPGAMPFPPRADIATKGTGAGRVRRRSTLGGSSLASSVAHLLLPRFDFMPLPRHPRCLFSRQQLLFLAPVMPGDGLALASAPCTPTAVRSRLYGARNTHLSCSSRLARCFSAFRASTRWRVSSANASTFALSRAARSRSSCSFASASRLARSSAWCHRTVSATWRRAGEATPLPWARAARTARLRCAVRRAAAALDIMSRCATTGSSSRLRRVA